jgi:hypothetical protein
MTHCPGKNFMCFHPRLFSAFLTLVFLTNFTGFSSGQSIPPAFSAYFTTDPVPEIKITLSEASLKALREKQREFTVCNLTENGKVWPEMAIKLKGAAGSFREIDDRPALTLNAARQVKGREFHGMRKFHLNNSVQDGTLLHEFIGSELFRQAGCPATRVGWARLKINDRDMGLYVLKEGFDQTFLKRSFSNPKGNLYDGGFCQDLDAALELDEGPDAKEANPPRKDLQAVVAACREPDLSKRKAALEKLVDIDSLFTFMAIELMLCHWDGYTGNKNNYRVYFDPGNSGKMSYLPHGMDQLFGDLNFPIWGNAPSMVPGIVLGLPEWRKGYRARLVKLRPLFDKKNTDAIIDRAMARLGPAAKAQGGDNALKQQSELAGQMKARLQERATNLDRLIKEIPVAPEPLVFDGAGVAKLNLGDWIAQKLTEDSRALAIDNGKALEIAVGTSKDCVASWRNKVLVPKGTYRFEARLKAEGITSKEEGASVRISGIRNTTRLDGSFDWKTVGHEFTISADLQEITMVVELRATAGRLLIDPNARIVRLK